MIVAIEGDVRLGISDDPALEDNGGPLGNVAAASVALERQRLDEIGFFSCYILF